MPADGRWDLIRPTRGVRRRAGRKSDGAFERHLSVKQETKTPCIKQSTECEAVAKIQGTQVANLWINYHV
jgi:hypothetical protein